MFGRIPGEAPAWYWSQSSLCLSRCSADRQAQSRFHPGSKTRPRHGFRTRSRKQALRECPACEQIYSSYCCDLKAQRRNRALGSDWQFSLTQDFKLRHTEGPLRSKPLSPCYTDPMKDFFGPTLEETTILNVSAATKRRAFLTAESDDDATLQTKEVGVGEAG